VDIHEVKSIPMPSNLSLGNPVEPSVWRARLHSVGYPNSRFLARGMEGLIFHLGGDGLVAKIWTTRSFAHVARLQTFYAELSLRHLPFTTPQILELRLVQESVVSIERELRRTPLRQAVHDQPEVLPSAIVDSVIFVLRSLASVAGDERLSLPVLDEERPLWRGHTRWGTAFAGLLQRRVARFGDTLRKSVSHFDPKLQRILTLLMAQEPRPLGIVHGDLVPPNILVDQRLRPTAVLDFGFLSTVGDPAFDAAVAISTFDMYGPHAARIEHQLATAVQAEFGYRPQALALYKAAYAVATANAYDPNGRDGHFAWCVQMLERPDIVSLLSSAAAGS